MNFYHTSAALLMALVLSGCGSETGGGAGSTGGAECPRSGCPALSCDRNGGVPDGDRCIGLDAERERGWTGFCVSGVCTEYVPVRCVLSPEVMVTGCDGTGMVSPAGMAIDFKYQGGAVVCSGVEGEFGYCAPGTACAVLQGDQVVGVGTCK